MWETDFQKITQFVKNMKVVNKGGEQGDNLMEDFSSSITKICNKFIFNLNAIKNFL